VQRSGTDSGCAQCGAACSFLHAAESPARKAPCARHSASRCSEAAWSRVWALLRLASR
jgi:hypothetical protein